MHLTILPSPRKEGGQDRTAGAKDTQRVFLGGKLRTLQVPEGPDLKHTF